MRTLNYISVLTFLLLALTSCEQKHNFVAELEGLKNDTILVEYGTVSDFFSGNRPKRDTIYAQDGKFAYNIPSQEPYFIYFHSKSSVFKKLNGQPFYANQNYIVTLIAPNDQINVTGKLNTYYIDYKATGSVFNEEYSNLRATYIKESSKGAALELKIDSLSSNNGNPEVINQLFKERNGFNRLSRKAELKYIEENPKENISAFFLTKQNSKNFSTHYSNLPTEVKNGIFKTGLDTKMKRVHKAKMMNEAKSRIVKGATAPNFSLLSITGEKIALTSIKDTYIVLDFWGTWCPPCIKGFPKMKEYYSKYKGKVEFIGIACNDTDEKWRKAIQKYNLEWLQLFNSKTIENDVALNYGIQNYPTKIILDKDKKIVEIFIGESEAFYSKLNSLLR